MADAPVEQFNMSQIRAADADVMRLAVSDVWLAGAVRKRHTEMLAQVPTSSLFFDERHPHAAPRAVLALSIRALRQLRTAVLRRRLQVSINGNVRMVVTAPHTVELHRDNDVNHVMEV